MSIDDVLKDKSDIAKKLTQSQPESVRMLRDLLMNAYVRGFFSGMRHTMMDYEEKQQKTPIKGTPGRA